MLFAGLRQCPVGIWVKPTAHLHLKYANAIEVTPLVLEAMRLVSSLGGVHKAAGAAELHRAPARMARTRLAKAGSCGSMAAPGRPGCPSASTQVCSSYSPFLCLAAPGLSLHTQTQAWCWCLYAFLGRWHHSETDCNV
jgi:hypothetical protein